MISQEEILEELAAIGFARASDYMTVEAGQLRIRDWEDLSDIQKAAVASVEKGSGGLKLKLYDKMKALELLGKMLGMFDAPVGQEEENNLLEAIVASTTQEVGICDLPEVQQAAAAGSELVEPAEASGA